MNIAEASIRNKTVTIVFAVLMVVLGIWSYLHLPRLEDPEFTIKDALIVTPYPGASAQEVEKEVSDVIELAAQQLEQLERVVSRSERGRSTVTVTIKDQYRSAFAAAGVGRTPAQDLRRPAPSATGRGAVRGAR